MLPSEKKSASTFREACPKREEKKGINISWNSALFFQVALILALLTTFWVIESDWELSPKIISKNEKRTVNEKTDNSQYRLEPEIVLINPSEPKEQIQKVQIISPVITLIPLANHLPVIETINPITEVDQNMPLNPSVFVQGTTKPNGKESLLSVQEVPVFPGCESLTTHEERKDCFQSKVQQFIIRKFDVDKFSEKYSGQKKKINVQFTINTYGQIAELKAVSPDKDLSEEAIRVISRLPQMIPGKNNHQPVEVVYKVPICLNITY